MATKQRYSPEMTNEYSAEAIRLTGICRTIFGDESKWITASGYDSLALSLIDSIFSTGSSYQSVVNVVNAYRAFRRAEGADPNRDGIEELLASFKKAGDSAAWAKAVVDNHKPAHTKPGAVLKAEVVYQAALALKGLMGGPILTTADIHAEYAKDNELTRVKNAWLDLPSQSSGVSYDYLLILAGFQSVKPDRMVIRFIKEHAGLDGKRIVPKQAAALIREVAELYPTQARKLDHVIWRHVSGRKIFRDDELN